MRASHRPRPSGPGAEPVAARRDHYQATAEPAEQPGALQLAATQSRQRADAAALPDQLTDDRSDLPAGERVALVMTEDRELARSAACSRCVATQDWRSSTSSCPTR